MSKIRTIKDFISRNERVLSPLALVGGFIVDALTLRRADLLPETVLLYVYLLTIGLSIILLHLIEQNIWRGRLSQTIRPWLPLALQFVFGSTFSAYLIFYSKSASIAASWPFLLILLGVFVGAEIFKTYHVRFMFQMSVFYFSILSFCIYAVPLGLGEIGTNAFLLSGAVSVATFAIFSLVLFVISPGRFKKSARGLLISVVCIYGMVNALYFLDILPPIPLSLKDVGIYHLVSKTAAGYQVEGESYPWPSLFFSRQVVHVVEGEPIYAYSSVFTPVAITTNVVHNWQYWSELTSEWVESGTVAFETNGGRDGGYRGYSFKRAVFPGLWRVRVETPDGRLIGETEFEIVFVSQAPKLSGQVLE